MSKKYFSMGQQSSKTHLANSLFSQPFFLSFNFLQKWKLRRFKIMNEKCNYYFLQKHVGVNKITLLINLILWMTTFILILLNVMLIVMESKVIISYISFCRNFIILCHSIIYKHYLKNRMNIYKWNLFKRPP